MKRFLVWTLTLAMAAGLLTGCGAAVASPEMMGNASADSMEAAAEPMPEDAGFDADETVLQPQDERKIIYNASISLESKTFTAARDALLEAAAKANAYVQQSEEGGSEEMGSRWVNYTFRVPSSSYRDFLAGAAQAGSLLSKSESTEDVTTQYVDVEARLESLHKQEERLLELSEKAETLEDLLAIENQLTDVRYRIESYTGQKQVLDNQISYSTVDVHLREVESLTPASRSFTSRLSAAFQGSWANFVENTQEFIIGFVYMLPGLIVLAVAAVVIVVIVRKAGKHRPAKGKAQPAVKQPATEENAETGKSPAQYQNEK